MHCSEYDADTMIHFGLLSGRNADVVTTTSVHSSDVEHVLPEVMRHACAQPYAQPRESYCNCNWSTVYVATAKYKAPVALEAKLPSSAYVPTGQRLY